MKKILILAVASVAMVSQAQAADKSFVEGKKLFQDNCLVCHNAELEPAQAPPMFVVQMKYNMATKDKASFVQRITAFATHPSKDKAILKEPVEVLGLMPDIGFAEEDVRKIAGYIHDETFSPPCHHWESAMKRFKAKGDMQRYQSHKKRFDMMCSAHASDAAAKRSSLKAIMQQLGKDYAAIDAAILSEDFAAAEQAAHGIAFHDEIPMATKMKLMKNLGSEMKSFKKADEKVHHLAHEIEQAAKANDMKTVIAKQSQMLGACMACHTSYRSRIIGILK